MSFLITAVPTLAQGAQTGPHVRSDDPSVRTLIEQGLVQSPTFRDIVDQIDLLPGIVYVASSLCGALSSLDACLDHDVRERGGYRYLRINLMPGGPSEKLIALLAHELQHALEILTDESATNQKETAKLYERIGESRKGVGNFETEAALRIQKTVMRELQDRRRGR